jgi:elongation factor P
LVADGSPVRLQEFLHVKPGKGSAFVRTKIKNLVSGSVQERTFRAGESIIAADVSKTEMQYTYKNGDMLCFMNMETFEEQVIDKDKIANVDLLIEGKFINAAIKKRILWGKGTNLTYAANMKSV